MPRNVMKELTALHKTVAELEEAIAVLALWKLEVCVELSRFHEMSLRRDEALNEIRRRVELRTKKVNGR